MKTVKYVLVLAPAAFCIISFAQDLLTPYERGNGSASAGYREGVSFFRELTGAFDTIAMSEAGATDRGEPLHVVTFAADRRFSPKPLAVRERTVVLVINAIHPGEPDGVDASMLLLRDLATRGAPDNVLVAVVPFYNVGGALNRNSTTRANQNGPREYGFRGNARNLDLNRDFMKADSRNAMSFARLFHQLDPDVFVDTHVSNGADYQHVLTLLATQKDKLAKPLGAYLDRQMVPALTAAMAERGETIVPYVNVFGRTPDSGWDAFLDMPRYSTGYAAQFQTLGFMTESHMLKPYAERVAATKEMLASIVEYAATEQEPLHTARRAARRTTIDARKLAIAWELGHDSWTVVDFRGYRARETRSEVSGMPRLIYDDGEPWRGSVRFFNDYESSAEIEKPAAYLIRSGYWPVIERLANAGVKFTRLVEPQRMRAEKYRIDDYETAGNPYEGHYPHSQTRVSRTEVTVQAHVGDVLVPMGTKMDQFLVNALEPEASDSYFNWNFFDTVLQRKEYFSSYVFEDKAASMLANDPALATALRKRRASDPDFANDARAQLTFVYERSEHAEESYRLYPVYRILNKDL